MLDTNKVRVSKRKEIAEKSPTLVGYGVQAAIGTGVFKDSAWQAGVLDKGPGVHGSKGLRVQGILGSKLPSPATAAPFCSAYSQAHLKVIDLSHNYIIPALIGARVTEMSSYTA